MEEKVWGYDIRCRDHPYYFHDLSTDYGRVCPGRPHLLTGMLKVKVKVTLGQVTKAQRRSRGIALLFL